MPLQIGENFGYKKLYEAYITFDSPPKIVVEKEGRVIRQFKDLGDFTHFYHKMESKNNKFLLQDGK